MNELTSSQRRRVEGICRHVEEYLALRLAHAERVNPKIHQFTDDLRAQMIHSLSSTLARGRAWGTEKHLIADVLCGDDLRRRHEVLNLTGQYSILHDIITSLDDHDRSADSIHITDMRTLYEAMDPSIGGFIELVQTWIWWDLPDAVTVHSFEGQLRRIQRLMETEITQQIAEYYSAAITIPPGGELTRDMMIGHEWRRLQRLITEFELRRRDDLPHQQVLRREAVKDGDTRTLVYELSEQLHSLEELEKSESLDDEAKARYADLLASDPAHVTRDHALHWQRGHIESLKRDLQAALISGQVLGPPYPFKRGQLEAMGAESEALAPRLSETARNYTEYQPTASTSDADEEDDEEA